MYRTGRIPGIDLQEVSYALKRTRFPDTLSRRV